ncbi:MAG: hypothetical protein ACTHQM_26470 [Thermoanaerobaculia bacterium]
MIAVTLTACTSTKAMLSRGISVAGRAISNISNPDPDSATLCSYYTEHRTEVDAVREYARANWSKIPDEYKPALVAINDRLIACDEPLPETSSRRIYGALKKAVALYAELRAAGVI